MKNDKESVDETFINPISLKVPDSLQEASISLDGINSQFSYPLEDLKPEPQQAIRYRIRAHKRFRLFWNTLIATLSLYLSFTIPYFLSLSTDFDDFFLLINLFIDVIFLADICFSFFTTYISESGEITSLTEIRSAYMHSWFIFDLFAVIPFDIILWGSGSRTSHYFGLALLTNLLKSIKLSRIHVVIRTWQSSKLKKSVVKIARVFVYLSLWMHISACIWYKVITVNSRWSPTLGRFKEIESIFELPIRNQYFICLYFGVFLSLGNEISPTTSAEFIAAALLITAGIIGIAIIYGELAIILTNLFYQQSSFQETLDDSTRLLYALKIPKESIRKVLERLSTAHNSLRSIEEYETFTKFVSPSIRYEILQEVTESLMVKNPVFVTEAGVVRFLIKKMLLRYVKDEEEVVSEGQDATSMFWLLAGEMKVMVYSYEHKKDHQVCFLRPGSHFGELALMFKTQRRASVVSESYSTVAEISKRDYSTMAGLSPNLIHSLKGFVSNYSDPMNKFIVKSLSQQVYFSKLPPGVLNEVSFRMRIIKIEKNKYLFKPGEISSQVFVLVEGKLQISATINDRYIEHLKVSEGILGIDSILKSSIREKPTDYSGRAFDIFSANALMRKPLIFTYTDMQGKLFSTKYEILIPPSARKTGNFMQEVIVADISSGSLINSRLATSKSTLEVQARAIETCVLYALDARVMKKLMSRHPEFKESVKSCRSRVKNRGFNTPTLGFDIINEDFIKSSKISWKHAIFRTILENRVEIRRRLKGIHGLSLRLKAVIACENAGNIELAEKVISGEILAEYITEDGSLIKFDDKEYSILQATHPIIRKMKVSIDELTNPEGNAISLYNQLAQEIVTESTRAEATKSELEKIKDSLKAYISQFKPPPPMLPHAAKGGLPDTLSSIT